MPTSFIVVSSYPSEVILIQLIHTFEGQLEEAHETPPDEVTE